MKLIKTLFFLILILYLINYLIKRENINNLSIDEKAQFYHLLMTNTTLSSIFNQILSIIYKSSYSIINCIKIFFITIYKFLIPDNKTDTNMDKLNQTYNLNKFINSLVQINKEFPSLINLQSIRCIADRKLFNQIMLYINNILNSGVYRFINLKVFDNIYYYKFNNNRYIEIFKFTADVYLEKNILGNLIFAIELLMKDNFENKSSYSKDDMLIINFKFLGNNNSNNNLLSNELFDKLFIKTERKIDIESILDFTVSNDSKDKLKNVYVETENSLIPSIVNISESSD
jgi:hypothetical protein